MVTRADSCSLRVPAWRHATLELSPRRLTVMDGPDEQQILVALHSNEKVLVTFHLHEDLPFHGSTVIQGTVREARPVGLNQHCLTLVGRIIDPLNTANQIPYLASRYWLPKGLRKHLHLMG